VTGALKQRAMPVRPAAFDESRLDKFDGDHVAALPLR
jgi:hypothetical protein